MRIDLLISSFAVRFQSRKVLHVRIEVLGVDLVSPALGQRSGHLHGLVSSWDSCCLYIVSGRDLEVVLIAMTPCEFRLML